MKDVVSKFLPDGGTATISATATGTSFSITDLNIPFYPDLQTSGTDNLPQNGMTLGKITSTGGPIVDTGVTVGTGSSTSTLVTSGSITLNANDVVVFNYNPYYDNGLKLFGPDGLKLSDRIEKKIEKLIDSKIAKNLSKPIELGRVKRLEDANENYIKILKHNFPSSFSLKGMKIALDCANGASYKAGPELFKSLGAKVFKTGTSPNGLNINLRSGSTYPKKICQMTIKKKAHIGIALDGDADRIIVCDENGKIIDGDKILAMLAERWKRKKILKGGVIGTLMSNYGLEKFFKKNGIKFYRSNVGDRYVKEKMKKNKFNLGGEQSGHIILGKFATTGDGLLVALEVLFSLRKKRKASELLNVFKPMPQILENIVVRDKSIVDQADVKKVIKQYGMIGFCFHTTCYFTSLGCVYAAISNGLEFPEATEYLSENLGLPEEAGIFAIAWGVNAWLTSVPRTVLTVVATPTIAKYLGYKEKKKLLKEEAERR
mgnify:CR=1 FL=1